jgi:hypothetical protein
LKKYENTVHQHLTGERNFELFRVVILMEAMEETTTDSYRRDKDKARRRRITMAETTTDPHDRDDDALLETTNNPQGIETMTNPHGRDDDRPPWQKRRQITTLEKTTDSHGREVDRSPR